MNDTNENKKDISHLAAIVPCYNAGDRLTGVIDGLLQQVEHVIVIDDGSTDDSLRGIDSNTVEVVVFPSNRGKGHAIIEGFRTALKISGVDAVCIVDADGQHAPAEIPGLYRAFVDNNADLVIGSRTFDQPDVPWRSRFGNKLTIALTSILLGQRIPDTQSGFRIHSRRLAQDIVETVPGGRYETEMEILVKAVKEDYKVISAPISTIYEEDNVSSHFSKLRDPIRIYWRLFHSVFCGKRRKKRD